MLQAGDTFQSPASRSGAACAGSHYRRQAPTNSSPLCPFA
ncbi:hypothetical protein SJ05684_c15970 [Sinorhizobium sojae CCBAU 05684]|uniref:Uncharacterized protein n=1 Tax=Sinorhizobium sojae CCBAU 05684 TaxID=716928 RepID=A0A249PCQ1_9HYPH|nr:hypothetical protein SJ05684_c15970 [Sinorhizobium sojae CCBAU 05684]